MRKISSNYKKMFWITEEDLKDFKEICLSPGIYIEFKGIGFYDTEGSYCKKLNDCDGTFWIDESYTEELDISSKINILDNKKIIPEKQNFQ